MSRRKFTKEFKTAAAQRLLRGESGPALAPEPDVKRTKLSNGLRSWSATATTRFPAPDVGGSPRRSARTQSRPTGPNDLAVRFDNLLLQLEPTRNQTVGAGARALVQRLKDGALWIVSEQCEVKASRNRADGAAGTPRGSSQPVGGPPLAQGIGSNERAANAER